MVSPAADATAAISGSNLGSSGARYHGSTAVSTAVSSAAGSVAGSSAAGATASSLATAQRRQVAQKK